MTPFRYLVSIDYSDLVVPKSSFDIVLIGLGLNGRIAIVRLSTAVAWDLTGQWAG